jgi:predicted HicB family RNase H-like nuclease
MSDTGFASLSSTLLARKGGARPAMRPQNGAPGVVDGKEAAASLEDLGWNDMGEEPIVKPPESRGQVVSLSPATGGVSQDRQTDSEPLLQRKAHSPVRDTIERIAQKLETPIARTVPEPRFPKPATSCGGKRAAFTLRLDQDRHLKLRLACTVRGRSAQQLVTEALDALLSEMPDIDHLAAQVKRD